MDLQSLFKKLRENIGFNNFIKENPSAYFCSGFFTIDKEGNDNKQHLDFFIPEKTKIFSFQIENNGKMNPLEVYDNNAPENIPWIFNVDFKSIEDKIAEKMKSHEIKSKIQKIILALQRIKGKNIMSGTVFLSMFGLLKINIDLENNDILDFEKKSFFDMIHILKKN